MSVVTPDDLARLKALAEAVVEAEAAVGRYLAGERHGEITALALAGVQARREFQNALSPTAILALIAAATPVPAGEFGERLRELAEVSADARSLAVIADELRSEQTRDKAERMCERREFLIAALTRSYATLLAERDAARAETSTLQNELANAEEAIRGMIRALQFYGDNWRGNMIGGGEQHNTYCFQEPTDELMHDAGSIARAALAASP